MHLSTDIRVHVLSSSKAQLYRCITEGASTSGMYRSITSGTSYMTLPMNTTSMSLIGAIMLGLVAATMVAFPVSANESAVGVSLGADASLSSDAVGIGTNSVAATTTSGVTENTAGTGMFTVLRSSLAAGTNTAPASADAVRSDNDLSAYASAALRADEHLDAVAFGENAVEVTYYEQGRLLALFPITMKARARVAADGEVTVSYPWYRFLVASDANTDLSSSLKVNVDADATLSVSEKAALMDEIRAALATSASAAGSLR